VKDIWSVNEHNIPLYTWLGNVCLEVNPDKYNYWRDRLSNAAYSGNWYDLWKALEIGNRQFGESWVNAMRLSKLADSHSYSKVLIMLAHRATQEN
jgi:hypothetical protein